MRVSLFKHDRRIVLIFSLLLGATSALIGCGQKGPLYLPKQFDQEQAAMEAADTEQIEAADTEQIIEDFRTTRTRINKEQGSLIPTR